MKLEVSYVYCMLNVPAEEEKQAKPAIPIKKCSEVISRWF